MKFTFCPLHAKILCAKILSKAVLSFGPFSSYDKGREVLIVLVALKLLQNPTRLMSITSTQLLVFFLTLKQLFTLTILCLLIYVKPSSDIMHSKEENHSYPEMLPQTTFSKTVQLLNFWTLQHQNACQTFTT